MLLKRLVFILFCLTMFSPTLAQGNQLLHIITQTNNPFPPSLTKNFEKRTGLKIVIEQIDSPEDMRKYILNGSRGDIFITRGYTIRGLIDQGLISPLNHNNLSNLKNIDPRYYGNSDDPNLSYHLPFLVGNMGLLYRRDILGYIPPSWGYFFDKRLNSPAFTMVDYYRDSMGAALMYLGHSYNSRKPEEIRQAGLLLKNTLKRPSFIGFYDYPKTISLLRRGLIYSIMGYSSNVTKIMTQDSRLEYVIPKEGTILWRDVCVISSRSKKQALAHQWLNFILNPKVAAEISDWTGFSSPNSEALKFMEPNLLANPHIYPKKGLWQNATSPESVHEADLLYQSFWKRLNPVKNTFERP